MTFRTTTNPSRIAGAPPSPASRVRPSDGSSGRSSVMAGRLLTIADVSTGLSCATYPRIRSRSPRRGPSSSGVISRRASEATCSSVSLSMIIPMIPPVPVFSGPLPNEGEELLFVKDLDSKSSGTGRLAPRGGSCDERRHLPGNGLRRLGSERTHQFLCFAAGHGGQLAGEDEDLAGEGTVCPGGRDALHVNSCFLEAFDERAIVLFLEEGRDVLGRFLSDAVDMDQGFRRGRCKRLHGAEGLRHIAGAYLADLRNAHGIQHTGKTPSLALFEMNQKLAGYQRSHALQSKKLLLRQIVEVSDIVCQSRRDELVDHGFSYTLDIHGVLRAPMQHPFPHLRGTRGVHTLGGGFIFDTHQLRAAHWAYDRHDEGMLDTGAGGEHRSQNLRDDRACLAHDDGVSDKDAKTLDLVVVVQGRPRNDRPVDLHRSEHCDRRCDTRSTDRDDDILEACFLFFRREFPGRGPSRFLGRLAQRTLQRYLVHLEYNTVGSKRQRTTGS